MIYDCFSYWDEDLLLDVRLNILDKFVDFLYLKKKFKSYLNEEILILDLPDELIKEVKKKPNSNLFWKLDGHYNVEGYKLVSEIISNYLLSINNYHIKTE